MSKPKANWYFHAVSVDNPELPRLTRKIKQKTAFHRVERSLIDFLSTLGFKWVDVTEGIKELFLADRVETLDSAKQLVHFRLMKQGDCYSCTAHFNMIDGDMNSTFRYFHHDVEKSGWMFSGDEDGLLWLSFEFESRVTKFCLGKMPD